MSTSLPAAPRFRTGSASASEGGPAFLQERLALFALATGALSLGFYAAANLIHLQSGLPDHGWLAHPGNRLHLGTIAVLGLLWLACRRGERPLALLHAFDAGAMLLVAGGYALLCTFDDEALPACYTVVLATATTLVARAVIVPSTALRTLAVGLASAVPAVASIGASLHASPDPPPGGPGFGTAMMALWLLLAVALTTFASRVIFGLRQEVRAARQLGQYTLLEKLGEGGMGEVYLARHALLVRPTAVKLLAAARAGEQTVRRFEREVQHTSRLTHPNTIAIYDYGRTPDGTFYYAMEYLDGVTLEQLVREDGPQPPGRVVHLVAQLLASLAEAHAAGLVHRDVKPANAILCVRGGIHDFVKVVDFGLVKELVPGGTDPARSGIDRITGTPLYIAPEAIAAPERVDARSDLYSVGAVAYWLLAGRHVFEGTGTVDILGRHLHVAPAPPSARLGRALPGDVEQLVLSCLEKDPARRPASAAALRAALLACADAASWDEGRARAWWEARAAAEHADRTDGWEASLEAALVGSVRTLDVALRTRAGDAEEARPRARP